MNAFINNVVENASSDEMNYILLGADQSHMGLGGVRGFYISLSLGML